MESPRVLLAEDVQGMLDTVTPLLREVMEYTLCVGTYGAPFQTVKAAQSSQESAGNTQPFMAGSGLLGELNNGFRYSGCQTACRWSPFADPRGT